MNRRQAIREKCLDCSGYEKKEVKNCYCTGCSLYPFRTGRGKQNPQERDRAIREQCMYCQMDHPREIIFCNSAWCPLYQFRGYNRTKKHPNAPQKVSYSGVRQQVVPEVISEHTARVNIPSESLYMNRND